jgi:SAM-dependent methyltransferase
VGGRDVGLAHGFSSVEAAAALGGAIARACPGWAVALKNHDLEVTLGVAGRGLTLGLKAAGGPALGQRAGAKGGLQLGRTALKVPVVHAMTRLALGDGARGARAGGLVVDVACGGGCLGLEAALHWPAWHALGGDAANKEARRLGRSLTTLARASGAERAAAGRCGALLWDAARLPLRAGCADAVCSDLPWGQSFGSRRANLALYPRALREAARVLRPGGTCVLLSADRAAMRAALGDGWAAACFRRDPPPRAAAAEGSSGQLEPDRGPDHGPDHEPDLLVNVGGKFAGLWVLRRTAAAPPPAASPPS